MFRPKFFHHNKKNIPIYIRDSVTVYMFFYAMVVSQYELKAWEGSTIENILSKDKASIALTKSVLLLWSNSLL